MKIYWYIKYVGPLDVKISIKNNDIMNLVINLTCIKGILYYIVCITAYYIPLVVHIHVSRIEDLFCTKGRSLYQQYMQPKIYLLKLTLFFPDRNPYRQFYFMIFQKRTFSRKVSHNLVEAIPDFMEQRTIEIQHAHFGKYFFVFLFFLPFKILEIRWQLFLTVIPFFKMIGLQFELSF